MKQDERELAIFIAILESIEVQSEKLYLITKYRIDNNLDWNLGYTSLLQVLINSLKIYTPKS